MTEHVLTGWVAGDAHARQPARSRTYTQEAQLETMPEHACRHHDIDPTPRIY
jgi:hypothetical protein